MDMGLVHVLDRIIWHLGSPEDIRRLSWTCASLKLYVEKLMERPRMRRLEYLHCLRLETPLVVFALKGSAAIPDESAPGAFNHPWSIHLRKKPPLQAELPFITDIVHLQTDETAWEVEGRSLDGALNMLHRGGCHFFHAMGEGTEMVFVCKSVDGEVVWEKKLGPEPAVSWGVPFPRTACDLAGEDAIVIVFPSGNSDDGYFRIRLLKLDLQGKIMAEGTGKVDVMGAVDLAMGTKNHQLLLTDHFQRWVHVTPFDTRSLRATDARALLRFPCHDTDWDGWEEARILEVKIVMGRVNVGVQCDLGLELHIFDSDGDHRLVRFFPGLIGICPSPDGGWFAESTTEAIYSDCKEEKGRRAMEEKVVLPPISKIIYACPFKTTSLLRTIEQCASEVKEPAGFEEWSKKFKT